MTLFKTSLLSGLSVLTKLATSVFLNKVLAVYVGPTGYAVIGQFQSLITMVTTFASGAVNQGVTKYTAEYSGDSARQQRVWVTAATMGLLGAAICGGVLVIAHRYISSWLLGSEAYSSILIWLALSLGLLVMNGLMLAILNGCKAIRELVVANIIGSLISASVATGFVMWQGLWGALLALAVSQAFACGFTAWIFQRTCNIHWRDLVGRIDPLIAKSLGGYALMAATSALVAPLSLLLIRDQIAQHLGWNIAGLWQAMWKISETHLLLLTSTLSMYFLPRFSEISDGMELRREVYKGYRFVLPVVITSAITLYLFRELLVTVLLSREFMSLIDVLGLQLVGDVLKIGSWVMAFTMVSHARSRVFVVTEVFFSIMLVLTTVNLSIHYGLRGAAAAYVITYGAYWCAMYWQFEKLVNRLSPIEYVTPNVVTPLKRLD